VDDPEFQTISSSPPMEDEVKSTLKNRKNGKTPGCCNITPEMLKAGGPAMDKDSWFVP